MFAAVHRRTSHTQDSDFTVFYFYIRKVVARFYQALYAAAITEITLPSTLQSIGQQALAQCKALELVRCLAKTPPSLGAAAFFRPTQSERIARLLVPRGTKQAYTQAGYGSYFFQIDELP